MRAGEPPSTKSRRASMLVRLSEPRMGRSHEGIVLRLLLLLLLLRLLRCVSFLCWGSELWLQGLGGLSATVRLDVAGAGARPSSAC